MIVRVKRRGSLGLGLLVIVGLFILVGVVLNWMGFLVLLFRLRRYLIVLLIVRSCNLLIILILFKLVTRGI